MITLLMISSLVIVFALYRFAANSIAQIPDRNTDFFALLAEDERPEMRSSATHTHHDQPDLEQSVALRSTSPTAIRLVHPT